MILAGKVKPITGKQTSHYKYRGGIKLAKQSKKDGGTKQKGKNKPNQKTSGSANGQNGYH